MDSFSLSNPFSPHTDPELIWIVSSLVFKQDNVLVLLYIAIVRTEVGQMINCHLYNVEKYLSLENMLLKHV